MYYRLGKGGQALWTLLFFVLWAYVTWNLMHWTVTSGMSLGDEFRGELRSVGLASIFSDFFKLFIALVGLFIVPILTIVVFTRINRKLKGAPMTDKENPYHRHLENCSSCRSNPLGACEEADRTIRQAVEDGSTNRYDRELDTLRNGDRTD